MMWSGERPAVETILATLAAIAAVCCVEGWVISQLWVWFVVPLGAPRIGIAHAIGLIVIVALTSFKAPEKVDRDAEKARHSQRPLCMAGYWLAASFLAWIVGFVAHAVM